MNTHTWTDGGDYWQHSAPQLTPEWFAARKCMITASKFGAAAGKSNFCKTEEDRISLAREICMLDAPKPPSEAMLHGIETEKIARAQYSLITGFIVEEAGFMTPKWNTTIGCSVDGIVRNTDKGTGLVEIKCPKKMYPQLIRHKNKIIDLGFDQAYDRWHNHIWADHMLQMQCQMAITGLKWCDYCVYDATMNATYIERIAFNQRFWESILQRVDEFKEAYVEPLVQEHGLHRAVPQSNPLHGRPEQDSFYVVPR